MEIKGKNILLISPEPWNHIFVSKHHYATHLGKRGNKVFFLNPPSKLNQVEKTNFENVFSVCYTGFIKGVRFLPSLLQKYLIKKKYIQLQNLCKVNFDIVWSFDNSVFFNFFALPSNVYCISHIVDLNQDFEFEKAATSANICLSTTNYIRDKHLTYNSKSFKVNHGYYQSNESDKPFEVKNSRFINCGYAGNLDIKYIDWGLIEELVLNFPEVNFNFAGPWDNKNAFPHVLNKPNFFFHGMLDAQQLYPFYNQMDILIIAYKSEEYLEQLANPHKMLEYLGAGKVIIATWTEEYSDFNDSNIIIMARNKNEFISKFRQVIQELDFWNNDLIKTKRKQFASNFSYENQINRIEEIISR